MHVSAQVRRLSSAAQANCNKRAHQKRASERDAEGVAEKPWRQQLVEGHQSRTATLRPIAPSTHPPVALSHVFSLSFLPRRCVVAPWPLDPVTPDSSRLNALSTARSSQVIPTYPSRPRHCNLRAACLDHAPPTDNAKPDPPSRRLSSPLQSSPASMDPY